MPQPHAVAYSHSPAMVKEDKIFFGSFTHERYVFFAQLSNNFLSRHLTLGFGCCDVRSEQNPREAEQNDPPNDAAFRFRFCNQRNYFRTENSDISFHFYSRSDGL